MGTHRRAYQVVLTVMAVVGSMFVLPGQGAAEPVDYTALGDSYASGVGTRAYYDDSGDCYRSPHAYPVRVAAEVGAALTFAACSGSRVADVRNKQLGSVGGDTEYVTVQVGGNDIGFVSVLTACARPWPYTCWDEIDEANRKIRDVLPDRLDALYADIVTRAPQAQVVAVGYPRLFNGEQCNAGARISPGEQRELNKSADRLARAIESSARARGIEYVDVRKEFTGHAVCDDVEWVNGLSYPILESYHPNRRGQRVGYTPVVTEQIAEPVPVSPAR
ncbi:SGNH/GDSL hydrolase family protein [Haloechinothrix halophila]|uniref:SGNH/GDSL hydrolase family protein n=1 Tax=Haloechinothrix halophila TaxID=1069073 RepID=UPI0006871393|nr:SGNH/GDSL hydrolase family protein [Haloechinothrix halophila]